MSAATKKKPNSKRRHLSNKYGFLHVNSKIAKHYGCPISARYVLRIPKDLKKFIYNGKLIEAYKAGWIQIDESWLTLLV